MTNLTDSAARTRPLSPHLSIYKPQISSVLSIFHRITGVALFFAFSMISWWFIFWVFSGFNLYYIDLLNHWIVDAALYATSYAFFYHLCAGIRHLKWDVGCWFSIKAVNYSGWGAIIISIILTVAFWVFI